MIEEGIDNLLRTDVDINAMVNRRVWPLRFPEGVEFPGLTYQIVGGSAQQTLTTSGLQRTRLQIDCWGRSYGEAVTLRKTVMNRLNGYQGVLSDGSYLQNAALIQPLDFYDQDAAAYRCGIEFYLYHTLTS